MLKNFIPKMIKRCFRNSISQSELFVLRLQCGYHVSRTGYTVDRNVLQKSIFSFISETTTTSLYRNGFTRSYAKKKKTSAVREDESEEEEEEDSDVNEDFSDEDELGEGCKSITKTIPSLRFDSVMKVGLGSSKKLIEKDFYAGNVRLNGQKVPKKSILVHEGDELDVVKGLFPENENLLVVNRVVVKNIGNITPSAKYPVKLHLFKSLVIENYEDKWP